MDKQQLLVLLGTFTLGFIAGHYLAFPSARSIPEPEVNLANQTSHLNPQLLDVGASAKTKIASNKQVNSTANVTKTSDAPLTTSELKSVPDNEDSTIEDIITRSDVSARIEKFQHFVNEAQEKQLSPLKYANQRYEQEPINYDWALEKEDQIITAFENQAPLNGIVPLSIGCKSANCKVVIAVEDAEQASNFSETFSQALSGENTEHGLATVTYFIDEASGEIVFYMHDSTESLIFDR
ncbi:hypothetical protein [Teredinibacter turnerae]|uniref:hypothetical protein n=1 Tax=Teredinibacter turnerae TaxID=2426 RepID=UPI0005F8767B|nr:hypothetical protein [Teredinibacter turnerae]